jgi:ribosomal protein S18 acetylase RimI-like enzyme
MPSNLAHASVPHVRVRKGERGDLDALMELEQRAFATDRLSQRSFRRFLASPSADVIVAEEDGGGHVGAAIVLFHPRSAAARLYSIAVAPHMSGRGVAAMLLDAAEDAALARDRRSIRLEVHHTNHAAIARYRKSGYRQFGRHAGYYQDGGDALRFEKRLLPNLPGLRTAPPYVHQTSEFTCGPACILMALAWADPKLKPSPVLEFDLWRQSTTIFMSSGPGGCGPYGLAVTLKRRGLAPELYVSRPGPYFLDAAGSAAKRRAMQLTHGAFQREAQALGIATHLTPVNESVLMTAFDAGSVAIVLVSGYHMVARGRPHWIFAFGRDRRHVLMHDPAAIRDEQGMALAPETYAVPWSAFEPMTRLGRERLSAAIVIRKGTP